MRDFGLTHRETRFLRSLSPPWRIQKHLDSIAYDVKGAHCRSPRRVLREQMAQCMDGAMFAAAALRVQGRPPLILDLEAVQDDTCSRSSGPRGWGDNARSNYSGLRYRGPCIRRFVPSCSRISSRTSTRREKTLPPFNPRSLARFDRISWMTAEEDPGKSPVARDHPAPAPAFLHRSLARARGRADVRGERSGAE
jgi:hypothetical protein